MAVSPYAATRGRFRRRSAHLPCSATSAGTSRTSAAPVIRAVTIAPGDHPMSMSERPKVPEDPNVAAETSAIVRPTAKGAEPVVLGGMRVLSS